MNKQEKSKRKEVLTRIYNSRKRQLNLLEELSKPVKHDLELIKLLMQNKISMERYLHHAEFVNKYLLELGEGVKV